MVLAAGLKVRKIDLVYTRTPASTFPDYWMASIAAKKGKICPGNWKLAP